MTAHRAQQQMMEIMPSHVGGFGGVENVSWVFLRNKLIIQQKQPEGLNEWLGEKIMNFEKNQLTPST
ncbi:TPA: hypothetical protein NPP42_001905 [Klebsiella pneumoniae]|uniref:hypothetical protein n=1 Tax=Klebsiella pneumoniae TaxID=573 RepID=UPI002DBD9153|nr:hypothetical protein [Klebsiella pneumoniae]MEB6070649.1 hypothetical protein [Klebsiella pneumoniae]HCI6678708.1 hypothetical protein [Klebsiella pneumoniae]